MIVKDRAEGKTDLGAIVVWRGPSGRFVVNLNERSAFLTVPAGVFGPPTCRLGLAARGDRPELAPDDILHALDCGVNFLNWPGLADGPRGEDAFSATIAGLGARRGSVVVCVQFGARTRDRAAAELRAALARLGTDYIDVLTLYYVEHEREWDELNAPGGVVEHCLAARRDGTIRRLGVTSHQRPLAAMMARSGRLDAVMVRYNAAHRGAERDVFPTTDALGIPVIAYTGLRWGALLRPTPDDPPGLERPGAADWYRFVLAAPSVAVALAAPASRAELDEDLKVLNDAGPLATPDRMRLAEQGDRVRRHAGLFP